MMGSLNDQQFQESFAARNYVWEKGLPAFSPKPSPDLFQAQCFFLHTQPRVRYEKVGIPGYGNARPGLEEIYQLL